MLQLLTGLLACIAILALIPALPVHVVIQQSGGVSALPTNVQRVLMIPAGSMDVTGGCITNDPAALVTNGPRLPTITCIDDNAASIEFHWISPGTWNAGTVVIHLYGFNTAAETTALVMHFAGVCVSTGEALAAHSTSGEQAVTLTWTNVANQEVFAATPTPITLQSACAAGDHVYMRGQVDVSGTTVANMATVRLLAVQVELTIVLDL